MIDEPLRPNSREKSGTSKRCTSARSPSAAAATWSFACAESSRSSRSRSHRACSFSIQSISCTSSCSKRACSTAHALAPPPPQPPHLTTPAPAPRTHAPLQPHSSVATGDGRRLNFQLERCQTAMNSVVRLRSSSSVARSCSNSRTARVGSGVHVFKLGLSLRASSRPVVLLSYECLGRVRSCEEILKLCPLCAIRLQFRGNSGSLVAC
jgi:hypothetical protein